MEPTYKRYVLELLENSSHRLRQIELMRYELQHIPQVSDLEIIEAMSLPPLTDVDTTTPSKSLMRTFGGSMTAFCITSNYWRNASAE